LIQTYALEEVTITPRLDAYSGDGMPTYASSSTVALARVQDDKTNQYRPDGAVLQYDRVFWLKPEDVVRDGDRIIYNGITHEVVTVERRQDIAGVTDHYRVIVRIVELR
jgi:hypothetical protein